jgi:hypothetical protein
MFDQFGAECAAPLAAKPKSRFRRTCLECGEGFSASDAKADFCCTPHRQAFNNRRIQRGGELYDLFMANRYDRDASAVVKLKFGLSVFTLLCRMAQDFRRQDIEDREGRPSWRAPRQIVERHPRLFAVATDVRPRARR